MSDNEPSETDPFLIRPSNDETSKKPKFRLTPGPPAKRDQKQRLVLPDEIIFKEQLLEQANDALKQENDDLKKKNNGLIQNFDNLREKFKELLRQKTTPNWTTLQQAKYALERENNDLKNKLKQDTGYNEYLKVQNQVNTLQKVNAGLEERVKLLINRVNTLNRELIGKNAKLDNKQTNKVQMRY